MPCCYAFFIPAIASANQKRVVLARSVFVYGNNGQPSKPFTDKILFSSHSVTSIVTFAPVPRRESKNEARFFSSICKLRARSYSAHFSAIVNASGFSGFSGSGSGAQRNASQAALSFGGFMPPSILSRCISLKYTLCEIPSIL